MDMTKQELRDIYGKYAEWGFLEQTSTKLGERAVRIIFEDNSTNNVTFYELGRLTEKLAAVLSVYFTDVRKEFDNEALWQWVRVFIVIACEYRQGFDEYWDLVMTTHYRFHRPEELRDYYLRFQRRFKEFKSKPFVDFIDGMTKGKELWLDRNIRI